MSVTAMLLAYSESLGRKKVVPVRVASVKPLRDPAKDYHNTKPAINAKIAKTDAKYRKVMYLAGPKEQPWLKSGTIDMKHGTGRGNSNGTLAMMVKRNRIERRPTGGKPYNRRSGWEYRWIGE